MPPRPTPSVTLGAQAGQVLHLGLGRSYRLLEPLAPRASTGAVWSAQWLQGGVPVALKWLPCDEAASEQPDERSAQQAALKREAVALRQCQHPHVMRLHTVGTLARDEPVLVLEQMHWAVHHHLRQQAHPGAGLTVPEALRLAHQLAQALQALHRSGRRHLDVKPANLLMSHPGPLGPRLKLADFGACTPLSQPTHPFLGTPGWLAPEQCQPLADASAVGQPKFCTDARADVFAVGQVLYYLLTGQGGAWARQSHAAARSGQLVGLRPCDTSGCAFSPDELALIDALAWTDLATPAALAAGAPADLLAEADPPGALWVDATTWQASIPRLRPAHTVPSADAAETPGPAAAGVHQAATPSLSDTLRRLCALQPDQRCAGMDEVAFLLGRLRTAWSPARRWRDLQQRDELVAPPRR